MMFVIWVLLCYSTSQAMDEVLLLFIIINFYCFDFLSRKKYNLIYSLLSMIYVSLFLH